ncbi:molecular chaperone DnaJ [Halodesulfurarchaeum sp.]|uniref:molecular chaperone DnaJ n=1 Tax=Halodesulfurarchaeum sp. TaxID=1980530 RepID=UPI002FC3918B
MSEDFYSLLGVSRDASEEEIKRAYRQKAAQNHPDVSDDENAEEHFKKLQKAKEVLTDEEKRRMYDQLGHEQFMQADKQGATDNGGRGRGGRRRAGGDPFGGGMGDIGDIFDQFFGGGRGQTRTRQRATSGRDLKTSLTISLEEATKGVTKQVTVTRPEPCDVCNGSGHPPDANARSCPNCNGQGQVREVRRTALGRVQQTRTCPRCEGDGQIYEDVCSNCGGDGTARQQATLSVDVPAGIRSGQTLRMNGEGAPGEQGAPNGDLLIEVEIDEHPEFERDGDDLHTQEPLSFPQAVFGDTIQVETIDGRVDVDIPAGTQSGETLRLRDEGIPHLRGRGQGDLYIHLQVVTPEDLSQTQKEALEQFAEAGGEELEIDEGFIDRIRNSL